MLLRLYYRVKPLMPHRLRYAVRRWVASRQLRRWGANWPIDPQAGTVPLGWRGWPDGKKFAFVLTHDVEGAKGLAQCRRLAELEKEMGFRSCFNFIPEGDYETSADLRHYLIENGFEVGVHDLNHDGHLYRSRESFRDKAAQINRYLKEWNAVGFRSGFMHHNYEWLHDLDVLYDASSFDTDPFEPQPDAVHTIFPFWIPRPSQLDTRNSTLKTPSFRSQLDPQTSNLETPRLNTRNSNLEPRTSNLATPRSGYVELPYTLPQDSTLFLLFREKSNEIWKRKLDWIVERGGMALMNVHPDYLAFSDAEVCSSAFPVRHYREFLQFVQERYAGQYWHAHPKEVAEYAAKIRPEARVSPTPDSGLTPALSDYTPVHLKGKRAAVVMFSTFPFDPRPRRAAEALINAGVQTDIFCLRQDEKEPVREIVHGANVHRLQMKQRRGGKISYVWQYAAFTLATTLLLAVRSFRRRYDLVHVHNMPDLLVVSGLIPKLLRARVVLDLHDPMPELMMTIFGLGKDSLGVRLLERVEQVSIFLADRVLTVNRACKKIFGARSCPLPKIEVIMNSPDETIFGFKERLPWTDQTRDPAKPFVIMCHGSIVERHGHDVAIEAVRKLAQSIPNLELRIYGHRTPFLDRVMDLAAEAALNGRVRYLGGVNLEAIVEAIDQADLGIIPNRRSIFTELNTPTRIFEYLARGIAVIAPRAPGIQDYFQEDEILFFELGNADDLAAKIAYAYTNRHEVDQITRRGQAIYRNHQWREERSRFLHVMDDLVAPSSSRP
jgi:glycosyltransferase involved in cell wall biosynthesis